MDLIEEALKEVEERGITNKDIENVGKNLEKNIIELNNENIEIND